MRNIRIGTRKSPLAMYQAEVVAGKLLQQGLSVEICPILSTGDKNLTAPLYQMGVTGVFTKDLDAALLAGEIDLAVHSLKDIPTEPAAGLTLAAVLERDYPWDILVRAERAADLPLAHLKIATSSLRRKAFWNAYFPGTVFSDIRGNVQTRLEKLETGTADATLFSQAAIERLGLQIPYEKLDMMIPAPGQGVIGITAREEDEEIRAALGYISCEKTYRCTWIERSFLNRMEGGCTAPIGAFAEYVSDEQIRFRGRLTDLNGENCMEMDDAVSVADWKTAGASLADILLEKGGKEIMKSISLAIQK